MEEHMTCMWIAHALGKRAIALATQ